MLCRFIATSVPRSAEPAAGNFGAHLIQTCSGRNKQRSTVRITEGEIRRALHHCQARNCRTVSTENLDAFHGGDKNMTRLIYADAIRSFHPAMGTTIYRLAGRIKFKGADMSTPSVRDIERLLIRRQRETIGFIEIVAQQVQFPGHSTDPIDTLKIELSPIRHYAICRIGENYGPVSVNDQIVRAIKSAAPIVACDDMRFEIRPVAHDSPALMFTGQNLLRDINRIAVRFICMVTQQTNAPVGPPMGRAARDVIEQQGTTRGIRQKICRDRR